MTKRIAIYARCSTADDQTTENQISELRAAAQRHGRARTTGTKSGRPILTDVTRDAICGLLGAGQSERASCSNSGSARALWPVCGPLWPLWRPQGG